MDRYVTGADVKKTFSVSSCALRRLAYEGRIRATRMAGGKRLYSMKDISGSSLVYVVAGVPKKQTTLKHGNPITVPTSISV